uniref:Uncharacterized protein n=1 Tax=Anguilla anguilla TaxID=7936 RepID=A0A0E9SNC2_ANGAN
MRAQSRTRMFYIMYVCLIKCSVFSTAAE